ncbi:hypothetical protein Mal15_47220 [Stieleria maiorica]|uniref:Secreted protein n=1 Tax=Stieleria maiorica TaxID=2795974 RepID=A0A5B9MKU6_9BACT|nr:hypothetical protein [Stieleria maiorica]QEG00651.1 hypothetical protein Mal15_47220 [Stieleria maiorica]
MKSILSHLLLVLVSITLVVGCDDSGPKTSTEGADAQAIADYEAAVAAAEGNMAESDDATGSE